jgi:chorismate mutase
MNNTELEVLRNKIDEIDINLCKLIKERQSLASKIMNAKKGDFPFDPNREEKLIKKLVTSGLDKFLVEKVWRQIISANLSIQKILKIGVAGNDDEIKSAYSAHFGNYFNTTYFLSVVSLLASLEKKDIEIGFIDSESLIKLKNHTDIKVNFEIIADVPLYKASKQKSYNIIKLKIDK